MYETFCRKNSFLLFKKTKYLTKVFTVKTGLMSVRIKLNCNECNSFYSI